MAIQLLRLVRSSSPNTRLPAPGRGLRGSAAGDGSALRPNRLSSMRAWWPVSHLDRRVT